MPPPLGRITVVDDDLGVRRAFSRMLRAAGHEVTTFDSAEDFLAIKERLRVDCLILDIHLGGMSGVELREALLRGGDRTPVVFVTAHEDPPPSALSNAEGFALYLRKPCDELALLAAVDCAIRSRPPGGAARN